MPQAPVAAVNRRGRKVGGGRDAPGKRGVGRNNTFKFRSSIFVSQRKSNNIKVYYDLEEELNEGAYGVVYKAVHKESGAERAVKKIEKSRWDEAENQKVIDEFNVLKGLDHPNILKMYELFEEEKHFYIVTDICKGGDLLDELEAVEAGIFPEPEAAILMNQVLSSINYCHKNEFVHRDLKPENILLEQNKSLNEVKLIDFGFAVPCDENHTMAEQKGTAAYMSPQAMLEEPYGQKTDVWAVGVIAYIVLAGFNPFEGHTDPETAVLVEMGEYELDIPEWDNISDDAKDFVKKCLEYEEKDRLTAEQALNHPWLIHARSNLNSSFYKSDADACMDAMVNLQKFHAQSKLKQATCTYIASQLISKEEKESIDKLYRTMDANSDGKLSHKEVLEGYKNIFGKALSDDDLDRLFEQVDMNADGVIEYSEFVVAAMKEERLLSKENLKKAFQMFDHDKDGFISRGDLVHMLNSFSSGQSVNDEIIDKIMTQVDFKNQGKIDLEEFSEAMFKQEINEAPQEEEEEEDVELEEQLNDARQKAKRTISDDSVASGTSSKKVNAKKAIQMPRRRSSQVAEAAAAKLKRNISGASDVSQLTDASGDSAAKDNNSRSKTPPPPAVEVRKPQKPAAVATRSGTRAKGIQRTRSGFMTQRAEPQNHTRRAGKKPGNAANKSKSPPPAKKADKAPAPPAKKKEEPKKKKTPARTKSESSSSSSSSSSSGSSSSSSSSSDSENDKKDNAKGSSPSSKSSTTSAAKKALEEQKRKLKEMEEKMKQQKADKKNAADKKKKEEAEKRQREDQAKKEEIAKREAEERAKLEAAKQKVIEEKRKMEEEAKRAEEEKRKREEAARRELEEAKAREEQEKKEQAARKEAREKARKEAEEKMRAEAAAAKKAAEEQKAKEEAERKEAEGKARKEAEEKAKKDAEAKAKIVAEAKAKKEAEAKAKKEAEAKAKKEAEAKAKKEAEAKAKKEAEAKAAKRSSAKSGLPPKPTTSPSAAKATKSKPLTPPEEKKSDVMGGSGRMDDSSSNHSKSRSDADAIKALKAKKKQQKRDSGSGGGSQKSLGNLLSSLPSSKKAQKDSTGSSNMSVHSVPAIPTQNSIQQRQAMSPSSRSPRPSILDRMNKFAGAGGAGGPAAVNKSPTQGGARLSPKAGAAGGGARTKNKVAAVRSSFGNASLSAMQTPDLDGSNHSSTPQHKRASTGAIPKKPKSSVQPLKASKANTATTTSFSPASGKEKMGSQSMQERSVRRSANGADNNKKDKGDLLAGTQPKPRRQNSFSNRGSKPRMPENAPRGSLKDRMKLFEKNIEGNKAAGAKKKLW